MKKEPVEIGETIKEALKKEQEKNKTIYAIDRQKISSEFEQARNYFDKNPNAIKFRRQDYKGSINHSYIKFNNKILCISSKLDLPNSKEIGKGGSARVVRAFDEEFNEYALRIENSKKFMSYSNIEPLIATNLTDINNTVSRVTGSNKKWMDKEERPIKIYSATYLGKQIPHNFVGDPDSCLNNSIQLLLELKEYQAKNFFHGDIKHENMILMHNKENNEYKLKFIDFPNMEYNPNDKTFKASTPVPRTDQMFNSDSSIRNTITKSHRESQAQETLYKIDRYTAWNIMTHMDKKYKFFLSPVMDLTSNPYYINIDSKKLKYTSEYFSSTDFLATYLITRKMGILPNDEKLLQKPECAKAITELYSKNQLSLLNLGKVLAINNISYKFNPNFTIKASLSLVRAELECALLAALHSGKNHLDKKRSEIIPNLLLKLGSIDLNHTTADTQLSDLRDEIERALSVKQSFSLFKPDSWKAAECHLENFDLLVKHLPRNTQENSVLSKK